MNSKFTRKRSASTYPVSKIAKLTTTSNAGTSPKEVPTMPRGEPTPTPSSTDVTSADVVPNTFSEGDWLTAICQSLGDVPAIDETSDALQPLVIDLTGETSTETTSLQNLGAAVPKLEDKPPARKPSKVLREWLLDDCLVLSLLHTDCKLHIRLQKCTLKDMDITMCKESVLMNMPTYVDFKNKIRRVDTKCTSSVICNNQLAIFSRRGELILHQIFYTNEFKLKTSPLKITHYTIFKVLEIIYDVDRVIENALICNVLSEKILEQSDVLPTHYPDLMDEFIMSLQREISRNVSQLFECHGCDINDPSQSNHSCMTTPYQEQLYFVGTNAFLMLDVKRVLEDLKTMGILECFSKTFFKDLCYADIESDLMKAPENAY